MILGCVNLIQEGESILFYRYDRKLNGYMIAGMFIASTLEAKLNFAKIWKYFVSEIVRKGDIYCSILPGANNTMFDNYLDYYDTVDGLKIYKVDNVFKNKYSNYSKAAERKTLRENRS